MDPGLDALLLRAASSLAPGARLFAVTPHGAALAPLPGHTVTTAPPETALDALRAYPGAFDAILLAWPSRSAPLMPMLMAAKDALAEGGRLFVCDVVWQTAPTLELLKAFAPAAGREKVRPIEGYEMQADHSGLDIIARDALERAVWCASLASEQQTALEADGRGAAKAAIWEFVPSATS